MAPKKSLSKGKEKPSGVGSPTEIEGWRASKCSDFHLLGLVEEKLLQPRELIHWRNALGDVPPHEGDQETIVFKDYILRGFGIPSFDFFHGLLFHCGIQAHHLNPNSILYISIFVHLCKTFLGIEPHFDLFQYFFPSKAPTQCHRSRCSWRGQTSVVPGSRDEVYPLQTGVQSY